MRYNLSEQGFKRVRYYIDEELFENFDPIDQYSCVDSWIYHLLSLTHNEETNLEYEEFCKEIFFQTLKNKEYTDEFLQAIKIIRNNKFIM